MGLFDNLGASKPLQPGGGSLFSNLGGQQSSGTSAPSLFGTSTATTSAAPSGGLFGRMGEPNKPAAAAPSGGLFGRVGESNTTATTSAGTGGSPFGSMLGGGAGTSTGATGGGGLFGRVGEPNATSAPASGGLFGSTTTTSAAGGGGLFGSTANQPATTQSGGLFGGSTATGTANAQGQDAENKAQQPGQPAYFNHLLERGRKRNAENGTSAFGEIPSLQLGLGDIARKVRNLGQGGPSAQRDGRADSTA